MLRFTAVFEKVPGGFIGFVEELPGANTQAATLDEARANLEEAVRLVLDANRALAEEAIVDREVNDFLAAKICRDLEIPRP